TVFGIEAMLALQIELPRERLVAFLRTCDDVDRMDFVHLCSLARAAAGAGGEVLSGEVKSDISARLQSYRTADGGFHGSPGKAHGSAYGALLAWGAYSDLGLKLAEGSRLLDSVMALRLPDGSFANERGLADGTTTATGAALTLCRHLGHKTESITGEWLLRQVHTSGGFLATPRAPLPDLLSTAVALHALDSIGVSYANVREACLDFVDSLWSATGGFHGHWADDQLDCEYTYYGLLALGHLAL
ncbi:MAG: prenyltransferase/squalene oxidase repeat-containing protein, partial [Verrucomicrobiaceae bacterium]